MCICPGAYHSGLAGLSGGVTEPRDRDPLSADCHADAASLLSCIFFLGSLSVSTLKAISPSVSPLPPSEEEEAADEHIDLVLVAIPVALSLVPEGGEMGGLVHATPSRTLGILPERSCETKAAPALCSWAVKAVASARAATVSDVLPLPARRLACRAEGDWDPGSRDRSEDMRGIPKDAALLPLSRRNIL